MSNEHPMPPPLHPNPGPAPLRSLGDDPDDRTSIPGLTGAIEAMLRYPRRVMFHLRAPQAGTLIAFLVIVALFCSLVYGVVVGSFSGHAQYWAAPVKIAAGLFVSALICLPSLY